TARHQSETSERGERRFKRARAWRCHSNTGETNGEDASGGRVSLRGVLALGASVFGIASDKHLKQHIKHECAEQGLDDSNTVRSHDCGSSLALRHLKAPALDRDCERGAHREARPIGPKTWARRSIRSRGAPTPYQLELGGACSRAAASS